MLFKNMAIYFSIPRAECLYIKSIKPNLIRLQYTLMLRLLKLQLIKVSTKP